MTAGGPNTPFWPNNPHGCRAHGDNPQSNPKEKTAWSLACLSRALSGRLSRSSAAASSRWTTTSAYLQISTWIKCLERITVGARYDTCPHSHYQHPYVCTYNMQVTSDKGTPFTPKASKQASELSPSNGRGKVRVDGRGQAIVMVLGLCCVVRGAAAARQVTGSNIARIRRHHHIVYHSRQRAGRACWLPSAALQIDSDAK